jgi:hypothetical protein
MLCKYKDSLGIPDKGLHKYRIFNIAIVDVTLTIIVSIILSYIFNINFLSLLIILFLLGIIMHRIFCVRTTIDKLLFS